LSWILRDATVPSHDPRYHRENDACRQDSHADLRIEPGAQGALRADASTGHIAKTVEVLIQDNLRA
jgi:hypothetical protein